MNVLTSDWEVSTFAKGNPFSRQGKAVCLGWKVDNGETFCKCDLHYHTTPNTWLNEFELCVFFNAKFDLHWYRRLGFEMPKNVWCCQLAEFILEHQSTPYPSLQTTAEKYGLSNKLDEVKLNYWDKGIDTDAIPPSVLADYCRQDVDLTYSVYLRQQEAFVQHPRLYRLFKLACQDLLILQEMEWNGLIYDERLCEERAKECKEELATHLKLLSSVYPNIAINFNSGDQLSAFLYGGTITELAKEPIGTFKTGAKAGQVRYQNVEIKHTLPRLITPLPKTEMAKKGVFSTAADTLKKLKGPAAKKYVGPLLEAARLEKLLSTYYEGIPKGNKEKDWAPGEIHGQFNQCVAATGRLSSSAPNLQNMAGEIEDIFISRYGRS